MIVKGKHISEYLYYDKTSPSLLRWRVDMYSGCTLSYISKHKDSSAGSFDGGRNYWKVQVRGRQLLVHRVVWELHNNQLPEGYVIDHLDGNGGNNLIDNLRCVLPQINARNRVKNSVNPVIKTGVRFRVIRNNTYVVATCRDYDNKVDISKTFSARKLGLMVAFRDAVIFRQTQMLGLNNNGAGYSNKHLNH